MVNGNIVLKLNMEGTVKLNIGGQKGCKNNAPGWKIVDLRAGADIQIDISRNSLPISDQSVDSIYTSHTLEHILPQYTDFVFKECYRVLKVNSKIRIVVPDIDLAIRAYFNNDITYLKNKNNPSKMDCLPNLPVYYLSSWFFTYKEECKYHADGGGHVHVFNKESLSYYLKKAGFRDLQIMGYNKCSREFSGCDFQRYKECSIYMEAIK